MGMKNVARLEVSGAAAALVAGLVGCAAPNDRTVIGRVDEGVKLSLITPEAARPVMGATPDTPSMVGVDRSGWEPVVIEAPVDGVYGWHRYARVWHFTEETSRQRGGPVTPLSALELSGDMGGTQVLEAAAAGPLALTDLALMPFKFFTAPPWEEVRSLPENYWRANPAMPVTGQTARRVDVAAPAGSGVGVTP